MNIGFFGDGPWSHLSLIKLLNDKSIKICFICARFDNPDIKLKEIALENKIDFLVNKNINSDSFYNKIITYNCDLFISMSFNQIFKKRIINHPKNKTINCHAGKLPFYRGRNILNWVLINDEKEFGITVHYMDEGIDTGDIILQKTYKINDQDNYSTLLDKAYSGCASLLYEAVQNIQDNNVIRRTQNKIDTIGTYCSSRIIGDEIIDWNQSSREIFNFIRAICSPGPQARTFLNKEQILINSSQYIIDAPSYKGIPGAVVGIGKQSFNVKTRDSFIKIIEWTYSSKIKIGDRLK